jgi:hypothetical protein
MSACNYVSDLIHATPEFVPACDTLSVCASRSSRAHLTGVCASHGHLIGAYILQDVHLAGAHLTGTISQAVSHRQYPHRRVSHKRAS